MTTPKKRKARKTLSKKEMQTVETIRTLTHVPLSHIQETLKGLATAISLQYADTLDKRENGENVDSVITLPYIGELIIRGGELLIEWGNHSFTLSELTDVKRAMEEDDYQLIESWYNRLEEDLKEKL